MRASVCAGNAAKYIAEWRTGTLYKHRRAVSYHSTERQQSVHELTEIGVQRDDPKTVHPLHHIRSIMSPGQVNGRLVDPALELPKGRDVVVVPSDPHKIEALVAMSKSE